MSDRPDYWRVESKSPMGEWLTQSESYTSFEGACFAAKDLCENRRRETRVVEVREVRTPVKFYPEQPAILAGKEQG